MPKHKIKNKFPILPHQYGITYDGKHDHLDNNKTISDCKIVQNQIKCPKFMMQKKKLLILIFYIHTKDVIFLIEILKILNPHA